MTRGGRIKVGRGFDFGEIVVIGEIVFSGAYLMHMIRSHFDVEAEFDKTIFKFMESL